MVSFVPNLLSPEPTILGILNLAIVIALIGVVYYSARILLHMHLGRLEKGWQYITEGMVSMCGGFLFLTSEHMVPTPDAYFIMDTLGTVLTLAGIILIFLGLRSQYIVWSRKPSLTSQSQQALNDSKRKIIDP